MISKTFNCGLERTAARRGPESAVARRRGDGIKPRTLLPSMVCLWPPPRHDVRRWWRLLSKGELRLSHTARANQSFVLPFSLSADFGLDEAERASVLPLRTYGEAELNGVEGGSDHGAP